MRVREFFGRIRSGMAAAFGGMIRTSGNVSSSLHVAGMDRPAENLLWVYLGMMSRAEAVSQVPLRIATGNDTLVESGALYDLLQTPNSWMDKVQYFALIESHLALYNECEIAIIRGARGNPIELIPLSPLHTTPVVAVHAETGMRAPVGWSYREPSTGAVHAFAQEDVIPILLYSPYDTTKALRPEVPGRRSMLVDILSQEQNLSIFKNGGMPDVVFETDQRWDVNQRDEFLEAWNDRYSGTANAHKPGILYGGLKAKAIGLSPEDLQFFEGRRMSRSEQIALMRVKPAMVGLTEGETGLSQGNSTREQKAAWWSETGLFELSRIAAAHQRFLVDKNSWSGSAGSRELSYGQRLAKDSQQSKMRQCGLRSASVSRTLSIWFDEHEIEELMEQRLQKVDILDKLLARGWQPDQMGDYLQMRLPPHPTNIATLPFSLQPASDLAGVNAEIGKRESRNESKPDALDAKLRELDGALADLGNASHVRAENDEGGEVEIPKAWQGMRAAIDRLLAEREKAAARKWSRFFAEQRGRVLDRYSEIVSSAGTREDSSPQLDGTDLSADGILSAVFPEEDENGMLWSRIGGMITSHMEDGYTFFGEHDVPSAELGGFSVDDPRVMEAIEKRSIQASKANATTEKDLRNVLRAGFAEGDTTAQLGDRLADYYRDQVGETKARPMTAARTQTSGIVNDGRMLAAREVGGLSKGWLHGGSKQARDAHVAAQSRYLEHPIALDDKFEVNGYMTDAPGSTELPVGEVANCTCSVVFSKAVKGDA